MGTDRLIDKRTDGHTNEKWLDGGTYRWINDGLMDTLRDREIERQTSREALKQRDIEKQRDVKTVRK